MWSARKCAATKLRKLKLRYRLRDIGPFFKLDFLTTLCTKETAIVIWMSTRGYIQHLRPNLFFFVKRFEGCVDDVSVLSSKYIETSEA